MKSVIKQNFPLVSGVLVLGGLAFAVPASACSCASNNSFESLSFQASTIVRAKVIEHIFPEKLSPSDAIPTAMKVSILEELKGKVESEEILIWGDSGILCRPYVSQFPVNTEWLFIIDLDVDLSKEEWAISSCGKHWKRFSS